MSLEGQSNILFGITVAIVRLKTIVSKDIFGQTAVILFAGIECTRHDIVVSGSMLACPAY